LRHEKGLPQTGQTLEGRRLGGKPLPPVRLAVDEDDVVEDELEDVPRSR